MTVLASKCVLNTLQFAHVETGQAPEERVVVIKATTHPWQWLPGHQPHLSNTVQPS